MIPAGRYPNGIETRATPAELRVSGGRTLYGLAAVWDRPTLIGGQFTEIVRRGAFSASLASGADIYLLCFHDFNQPIGRTGNGSLQLRETGDGLTFEATLPETRAADDILALARSGTIAGASFAFRVPPHGDVWPAPNRRELRQVTLIEVSAVTAPAYADTTISARSRGGTDAAIRLRRRFLESL